MRLGVFAPALAMAAALFLPAAAMGAGAELASAGGKASSEEVPADPADRLQRHRNLGKAFYENPATQYDAVPELEKALALAPDSARDRVNLGLALLRAGKTGEGIAQLVRAQEQDPSIPHTWFNLGIAYKKASAYEKAIAQLEGMLERVPDEPVTHYNLGVLYKLEGEAEKAVRHFERSAELDPSLAGPWFQLATAYRQAGRAEDATRAMNRFRERKARDAGAAVPEDLEWSWYAEIYETIDPEPRPEPAAEVRFEVQELEVTEALAGALGLAIVEAEGTPAPDLLVWAPSYMLLLTEPLAEPPSRHSIGFGDDSELRHVAAGDVDGDGRHEVAVVFAHATMLGDIREDRSVAWGLAGVEAPRDCALFLDHDHDYDPDLLLFGSEPALLRNEGPAAEGEGVAWGDRTEHFPFAALAGGGSVTAVARLDVVADTQGEDVAVARSDGPGILFRDRLGGRFEAVPLPELPAGTRELLAADVDHDGWTDLVAATERSVTVLRNRHRLADHEGFEPVEIATRAGAPIALLDLENRGAADLVAGGRVFRDLGGLRYVEAESPEALRRLAPELTGLAAVDLDGDGRTDLAAVTRSGAVLFLRNVTDSPHGSLRIALAGVKNPKLASGAEVEVKAGSLYQKRLYDGVPLVFGLGGREEAETVRITWPNGLIQNETRQAAGTSATYEEAQRLAGSCPMVFTWNGEAFEFITDVLGVAPLGAAAGEGRYFAADHDEVVQIAGEALAVTPDGRYEVRITEELREVGYLDQVRLLAVDHPATLDVFTNDKFKGPPFPEFLLFGVERADRRYPTAARDHLGRDVLERLLARDATYPDGFRRDYSGLAELHHLELDFGPSTTESAGEGAAAGVEPGGRELLVLSGWVDWADGSTFLAAGQGEGAGLILPRLQVKDGTGRWVTVIEDMGVPAGKPKTIVVDLTGKWLSESRAVRIVTSACVYWDEVFLARDLLCDPGPGDSATPSRPDRLLGGAGGGHAPLPLCPAGAAGEPDPGRPGVWVTEVPPRGAALHFRGFARPVVHPLRLQPEVFVYADWSPVSMWDQTPGLYTRYGPVAELLRDVDDRFVVFGAGDEIRLSYDATALPELPEGWRRSFLLWVDGWAKDGDANTAHSQTVGPLPFHGMPGYPYEPPHAYPDTPEHRLYREHYLVRPALRTLRPLTEGTPADPRRTRTLRDARDDRP